MYLDYYDLKAHPFKTNPDPAFLWLGEKHKEALSILKYGILKRDGFLLLTGNVGTGKTSLIRYFLRLIDSSALVATIHDPDMPPIDFFNYLSEEFKLHIWAHYGGMFDFRLAFEWLFLEKGTTGRILDVDSTILECDLRIDGTPVKLIDSIRILPGSLASVGEALGYAKGGWDHTRTREALQTEEGKKELLAYCIRDCEILWKALEKADLLAASQGVELRSTLASTSSASVRVKLQKGEEGFTPSDIEGQSPEDPGTASAANFGGRVEEFEHTLSKGTVGYVYDFHSAYPAAMARAPLPWRYKTTLLNPRKFVRKPGFVEATIRVPECEVPVIPSGTAPRAR